MRHRSPVHRLFEWRLTPFEITAIYALLGALWILFSDAVVAELAKDPEVLTRLQTIKGWFYVLATAGLLYGLIRRSEATIRRSEETLRKKTHELDAAVTSLKKTEKELRESEAKYRIVADNTYGWEFWISPQGQFLYCSPSCERITGYAAREFGANPDLLSHIVHPDDAPRWLAHRHEAERGITPEELEFRIVSRDGGERWISHLCQPVYDADGQFLGTRGSNRNITERKRAEEERERLLEEVQEERSKLQVLIETAPMGIAFHSAPDGRLLLFNKAAEIIVGRPLAPEVGVTGQAAFYGVYRPSGEPFPPEELPASRSLRGELCIGVEMLIRQPSGRQVYILANSAPLRDAEGQITGAVVAFQDITPIREQERLRDEFISTAAHELKTPVTTIKGYAQLMLKGPLHEPREAQIIQVINAQTDRISRRVQEMLEVIRFRTVPPALHRVRFNLGDLTFQVVQRMQVLAPLHRLVLQREVPVVMKADHERIEEVLVSLLDNAVKFSPKGGGVEVRVWAQEGEAIVSVKDYGVGISKERQAHIFEPFYEAVPSGAPGYRGVAALSLYLSEITIERHKGRIWFESEEDKGSTFYFTLPLAEADTAGRTKPKTVMVID